MNYFEELFNDDTKPKYDLSLSIIRNKVNMNNIDEIIEEFTSLEDNWPKEDYDSYSKIKSVLNEIKSSLEINLFVDKDPYIKVLTNDKVINLTGQTGSGKTTYANEHYNSDEYLVVDTDEVLSDNRFKSSKGINKELGEYFRSKYEVLPNCGDDFDLIYEEILDYCKKYDKTIVIDCAQFHCIKDTRLLKGKLIVMRTCIDNCYERAIERYKSINDNYTEEELSKYKEKKKAVYTWYKYTNEFLKRIDNI